MSRKYKFWDTYCIYFISFATINWIDVFTRSEYKEELIKCWQHCQEKKGLEIYAWCIMPSHVHMVIRTVDKPLEGIVRDMKSYTSSRLKKLIKEHEQESRREWIMWMMERAGKRHGNNNHWQFWQQHNQPIEIVNQKMYDEILWYIHQNPVVSGFVYEPEHWIYSSA
jgi:REP element-mobilizing transposase RayT